MFKFFGVGKEEEYVDILENEDEIIDSSLINDEI